MNETQSVVMSLHRCFGSSFYLLGLLKFTGDALGFVGPLVLSALVQFIDNKTEPMIFGYFCAAALCIASFTGINTNRSFFFNFQTINLSEFIFFCVGMLKRPCVTSTSTSKSAKFLSGCESLSFQAFTTKHFESARQICLNLGNKKEGKSLVKLIYF